MKSIDVSLNKPSYWQSIFLQSKVNGAPYNGEDLPGEVGIGRKIPICSADCGGTGIYTR